MTQTPAAILAPFEWDAGTRAMLGSVSVYEGDRLIAEVHVFNRDDKTALEKARLIAAAPELLAALERMVNYYPFGNGVDDARAAIDRATGGAS